MTNKTRDVMITNMGISIAALIIVAFGYIIGAQVGKMSEPVSSGCFEDEVAIYWLNREVVCEPLDNLPAELQYKIRREY